MPNHVHLLLTPLRDEAGWPCGLAEILKLIKGASARNINKLLDQPAQSGRKNPSTTFCVRRRAWMRSENASVTTQCAEGWSKLQKSIRGYG
jgi:REP element-mobilizing transposase RayT